jgi:hypothetical protein
MPAKDVIEKISYEAGETEFRVYGVPYKFTGDKKGLQIVSKRDNRIVVKVNGTSDTIDELYYYLLDQHKIKHKKEL